MDEDQSYLISIKGLDQITTKMKTHIAYTWDRFKRAVGFQEQPKGTYMWYDGDRILDDEESYQKFQNWVVQTNGVNVMLEFTDGIAEPG